MANSTAMSNHSFGVAVDINPGYNPYAVSYTHLDVYKRQLVKLKACMLMMKIQQFNTALLKTKVKMIILSCL